MLSRWLHPSRPVSHTRELSILSNFFGFDRKKSPTSSPADSSKPPVSVPKPASPEQLKFEDKDSLFKIQGSFYPRRGPRPPDRVLREVRHVVKDLAIGPKKLNLVCTLIRKMEVPLARTQLRYSKKEVSKRLLLELDRACAAAERTLKLKPEELIVGQCYVGGKILGKKQDIKGRGRTGVIQKRQSTLNVVLYEHPSRLPGFESKVLRFPPGQKVYLRRNQQIIEFPHFEAKDSNEQEEDPIETVISSNDTKRESS